MLIRKRNPMENLSLKRLDQLTGLRFFAAFLVFLSHLNWNRSHEFFQKVFESGFVGVSFFFALSGFVLAYSYQEKLVTGKVSKKKFIFLRFVRLTPLHFATALPFVGWVIYTDRFSLLALISNITYMQSWVPHSDVYFSLNAPSWSLSNEMFFYVCFCFLALMTFRSLFCVGMLLLAVIIVSATFFTIFYNDLIVWGSLTLSYWMFYIFPGFRLLEFLCGILLFRLWKVGYTPGSHLVIPAYILLFASMYFANRIPEAFRWSVYFLLPVLFFLYAHLQGGGIINRILKTRLLVLLGNASFAFYLIHQPIILVLKRLLSLFNLSDFGFFMVSLVISILLSLIIHLVYEKWAERKLKEIASRIF